MVLSCSQVPIQPGHRSHLSAGYRFAFFRRPRATARPLLRNEVVTYHVDITPHSARGPSMVWRR